MILTLLVSQITGILASAHFGSRFAVSTAFLVAGMEVLIIKRARPRHDFFRIAAFCALVLFGYILGTLSVAVLDHSARGSAAELAGRAVSMKGRVHWLYEGGYGRQFLIDEIEIEGSGRVKGNVLIEASYNGLNGLDAAKPGDVLTGKVTLALINGRMNPGGFDARAYWALKGTCAKASPIEPLTVKSGDPPILIAAAWRFYTAFRDFTKQALTDGHQKAMMDAIVLSDKSSLDPAVKDAFSEGGIAHVMSASGLHVSIVIGAMSWIMGRLGLRAPLQFAALLSLLPVYAIAAGLRPSIIRALLMGMMSLTAKLFKIKDPGLVTKLALAGVLQLTASPASLFDKGFLLSYAAILGVATHSWMPAKSWERGIMGSLMTYLYKGMSASMIIAAVALPITATFYGSMSMLGPIANLVAIPSASAALTIGLGSFSASIAWPWLGATLVQLSRPLLFAMIKAAEIVSSLKAFSIGTGYGPGSQIILYYAILLLGLSSLFGILSLRKVAKMAFKRIGIALCLLAILTICSVQQQEGMRIDFFSVGQGDSALVRVGSGFTMLVDTGPAYMGNSAVVDKILPALRHIGITSIDVLMLTHGHSDHISGLDELVMSMEIGTTLVPEGDIDAGRAAIAADLKPINCTAGLEIEYGDLSVIILNPRKRIAAGDDLNEKSMVALADFRGNKVLLLADAGFEFEGEYEAGDIDAIKVGHHGSRTASGNDFLSVAAPETAVISVGRNIYGHPSSEAMARLESVCDFTVRTDQSGMISLISTANGIEAATYEESWMARPFFRALLPGSYYVWN